MRVESVPIPAPAKLEVKYNVYGIGKTPPVSFPESVPVELLRPLPALAALTVYGVPLVHCTFVLLPVEPTSVAVVGSIARVNVPGTMAVQFDDTVAFTVTFCVAAVAANVLPAMTITTTAAVAAATRIFFIISS